MPPSAASRIRYGGLIVLMLMGFLLVRAEFLPNGVLTEMADGLGVTPGQAGQTVTVTALVGLIVAPTVGLMFPRLDRRSLLVWMALAAAVSNLIVAIAPNLIIVLLARFLLGAAISAFWAMSITVAARLAGPENLGRGVMFTSAGVSLATVAGVPLGVMLSELVDWRMVFAIAGVLMVVLAVVLRFALPSVPADRTFAFFAVFAPLVIAVSVMSMILFSGSIVGVGIVVLVWGFFFSSWLIVANTWVGHRMPDRLEAGGSLVVVGFQGAITLAAGIGGLLVDTLNVELVYVIGSIALLAGAVLFGASNRVSSRA